MLKKIVSAATTVLSFIVLAALVLSIAGLLITKISGGEPQLFGYRLFVIATGSMSPALEVDDLILSKTFQVGDKLEVGDILTYHGSGETEGSLVTHRLHSIEGNEGERKLILRGDYNDLNDNPIYESEVSAKYICKLTILGFIFRLMRSKFGMPVLLLLILLFIIFESLDFMKTLQKRKEGGNNTMTNTENMDLPKETGKGDKND